jgi:hypothetical protein|tara:strand:- start:5915 stop:8659 length:2745 start_codon:yes stop_codon:yes gene_type:complete
MKELANIYKEAGQRFVDDLFKDYLLVTEKLSGSSFSFERHGDELKFFKGSNKMPINLVDRTLMMYYESAIQYILDKTEGHIKDLPEYWRFCFQYFVNNQPGAIKYDNLPTNNLVLTHIQVRNPKGKIAKVIEDPRVLRDWASAFNVTPLIPIFSGYLKEDQKRKIREFLSTPKEDQLEVFGTSSFAKYLIDSLNPTIKQTTLQSDLTKPIDSIIFKFFKQGTKQIFTAKMIDPYTETLMKNKEPIDLRRAPADINEILLLDILAFIEERGLRGGELLTANPHERYLELVSNLFNDYVAKRGVDLKKLDIEKAEFAKGPEFDLNLDLIKNTRTREILQKSESLQNLYKIILGSLRKKRNPKRVGAVMTASVIEDFNKLVTKISDTINKETDGKFKTFGDYLNNKVTEEIDHKDLEELIIEEKALNYNNFINLGKIDVLNENKRKTTKTKQPFWDSYFKNVKGAKDPTNTKRDEVIRAPFGLNGTEAEENIKKMFKGASVNVADIVFNEIGVLRRNGLGSNDYPTYTVITTDGDEYYVTNNIIELEGGGISEIGKKVTNPNGMGIADRDFNNASEVVTALEKNLKTLPWSDSTKNYMLGLANAVRDKSSAKFANMEAFWNAGEVKETISLDGYIDPKSKPDERSMRNLVNDYGEVLDGIYILKTVKNLGNPLVFPESGNEALADIYVSPWAISAKAKTGGGKPSINALVDVVNAHSVEGKDLNPADKREQELYDLLLELGSIKVGTKLKTVESYIAASNRLIGLGLLKNSGYELFLKKSELNPDLIDRNDMMQWLTDFATNDPSGFDKWIVEYVKATGVKPKDKLTAAKFLKNKRGDAFYYPFAVQVARVLNKYYKEALKSLINKLLVVKQMYFGIDINKNVLTIRSTSSNTIKGAAFQARGSARTFNAGLGYEMK